MLCEKCHKNEASVFVTEIVNNHIKKHCLCESCAQKASQIIETPVLSYSFEKILMDFLELFVSQVSKLETKAEPEEKCSFCGISFQDFQKNPRFGCFNDYDIFKKPLEDIFQRIHGKSTHIGKKTKKFLKEQEKSKKLENFQKQLKLAIKEERYEDAAVFRDQIDLLERQDNAIL